MSGAIRRAFAFAVSPYVRWELPFWGVIAKVAGILNEPLWRDSSSRTVRGKLHGYEMRLDLASWSDRQTYFLQRYYDLPSQLVLEAALREGDRFIDVGANIGMITLEAAHCVGKSGSVISFEPNPLAFSKLHEHVRVNALSNVTLHELALSDHISQSQLQVVGGHTGAGTLGMIREEDRASVSMSVPVNAVRGDDMMESGSTPTVLKIDVEGFELHVLRGFQKLLTENRPMVLTETIEWYLQRSGSSLGNLYAFMTALGYQSYDFSLVRSCLHHEVVFNAIGRLHANNAKNIAWIHPESIFIERLMPTGKRSTPRRAA